MNTIKITKEEVEQLKNIQQEGKNLMEEFGYLEFQIQTLKLKKEILIDKLNDFGNKEKMLANTLQTKYGDGSINLEKEEFIKQ